MKPVVQALPPQAPRRGNAFSRACGRALLRLGGWRVVGQFPDTPRLVIIVAPHSSAWDGFWGFVAMLALGVHITFLAKAELFKGPLGWLLRLLGGVPVDRSQAHGAVGQAVEYLNGTPPVWFLLAPEGTRRRVERWKSGFWHIAKQANVPIMCAFFHYPEKIMGLGQVLEPGPDPETDMARIRDYYQPFVGKHRGI